MSNQRKKLTKEGLVPRKPKPATSGVKRTVSAEKEDTIMEDSNLNGKPKEAKKDFLSDTLDGVDWDKVEIPELREVRQKKKTPGNAGKKDEDGDAEMESLENGGAEIDRT